MTRQWRCGRAPTAPDPDRTEPDRLRTGRSFDAASSAFSTGCGRAAGPAPTLAFLSLWAEATLPKKNASSAESVGGIRQLRRSPTYSSHSLPSNAWWRTRLGGKLRQGPPAAEGGGRRPALTGLATQPYSVHRERRLDAPADASAVQTRTDGCSKRDPNLDYFEAEWQFLGIIPEAVVTGLIQTPESLPVTAFLSLSKLHGARAG